MSWTYLDYLQQPSWFLSMVDVKMEAESTAQSIKDDIAKAQAEAASRKNG